MTKPDLLEDRMDPGAATERSNAAKPVLCMGEAAGEIGNNIRSFAACKAT